MQKGLLLHVLFIILQGFEKLQFLLQQNPFPPGTNCSVPQKKPHRPHGRSSKIPWEMGFLEAKILVAKSEAKLEFPWGRGVQNKNLLWGSMDIFWNCTLKEHSFPLVPYSILEYLTVQLHLPSIDTRVSTFKCASEENPSATTILKCAIFVCRRGPWVSVQFIGELSENRKCLNDMRGLAVWSLATINNGIVNLHVSRGSWICISRLGIFRFQIQSSTAFLFCRNIWESFASVCKVPGKF